MGVWAAERALAMPRSGWRAPLYAGVFPPHDCKAPHSREEPHEREKAVLVIGLVAQLVEITAFPGMTAEKVRLPAPHFLLFEKLINVIHAQPSQAKICFNTGPVDAVKRGMRD
jgi:hypothetical protein